MSVPSRFTETLTCQVRRDRGVETLELPQLFVEVSTPAARLPPKRLGLEPLIVGSGADCALVAQDPSVSRQHCEVRLTDRGVVLRDLGSKNGTFVGSLQVFEILLAPGVEVALGSSQLTLTRGQGATEIPLSSKPSFGGAVGSSTVMRALFARLERVAPTRESVLLLGETGTGKELLARAMHDASPRRDGPFVVFDCGAIAPNLIEAELFGYVKGAFTGADSARVGLFEEADGGTLFLDELGELPIELQPKLLRAVESRSVRPVGSNETRPVDVRIVGATHRNLLAQVAKGAFREDLYYRLAVVTAEVPALRERKEDIALLVERFLSLQDPPRTLAALPPHALDMMRAHQWPGNVRELRNAVARWVLFPESGGSVIERVPRSAAGGDALTRLPLREARELAQAEFEKRYVEARLREHAGVVSAAADAMGVSRQFLYRLIARHGIKNPIDG